MSIYQPGDIVRLKRTHHDRFMSSTIPEGYQFPILRVGRYNVQCAYHDDKDNCTWYPWIPMLNVERCNSKCTCSITVLLQQGCQCGGD